MNTNKRAPSRNPQISCARGKHPQIVNQIADTVLKHLFFDDGANLDDLLELPDGVMRTVLNMGKMEPAYNFSKHVPNQNTMCLKNTCPHHNHNKKPP